MCRAEVGDKVGSVDGGLIRESLESKCISQLLLCNKQAQKFLLACNNRHLFLAYLLVC